MGDCSNHKKDIARITDMKVLAEMIGDLHYESLSELFSHLYEKLYSDGAKDSEAGRPELGSALRDAAYEINRAQYWIEKMWEISKPFMKTSTDDQ